MPQDRFDELLSLLLDEQIGPAELDELVEIASGDPHRLRLLREHLAISDRLSQYAEEMRSEDRFMASLESRSRAAEDADSFLSRVLASVRESESGAASLRKAHGDSAQKKSLVPMLTGWATAAVAALLLIAVLVKQYGDAGASVGIAQSETIDDDVPDSGVAVLTEVSALQGDASRSWIVGETIPPGTMSWETGLIQLEFYCGATIVVEGPAEIEILDEFRVVCQTGRLRAHVPEPARGFAVLAPNFELVDLGTEFGLNIADDGSTEVHVFDGKVELYEPESNRDQSTRRELQAGEALTVKGDGSTKEIEIRDEDFVTPNRLRKLASRQRDRRLAGWKAFRESLRKDPRVVAYFPFDRNEADDRLLVGYDSEGLALEGAIVGCEWSEGRWAGEPSLQFKRPGDRVRINIPGEFDSLTYSTWLRVDGLDRQYSSLLLTDGYFANGLHWQIRKEGVLVLGVKQSEDNKHNYRSGSIFDLFHLGQWVHLATVLDRDLSNVSHYVNGKLATREPLHRSFSGVLRIGNASIGNWSFPAGASVEEQRVRPSGRVRNLNGCIDELIVFGQALDAKEVRRIYEIGRP
ncbi:MAG: LamG-like jellyroll fold domain-containing protein [Planctomycetota bacterium]